MEAKLKADQLERLIALRKHLHANPELSGNEFKTVSFLKDFLKKVAPSGKVFSFSENAFAWVFGHGKSDETILLRADTDALSIFEINDFAHKSLYDGVSHKCGHDGHSAIMCGVAMVLQLNPLKKGRVVLLFQPAEEIGEGAKKVIGSNEFQSIKPKACYALHNVPGYKLGQVVVKHGAFTASVVSLIVKLKGKSAHAAEPENGFNPAYAISKILLRSKELVNPDLQSQEFTLITPTHGIFGDDFAFGTSAFYGELRLTLRSWTNSQLDLTKHHLIQLVKAVCVHENIDFELEWTQEFRANINDQTCVQNVINVANNANLNVEIRDTPFKWGEDFGLFTEKFKGCMFGIGSGQSCAALHNPDYDFPDQIIPSAVSMFYGILKNELV